MIKTKKHNFFLLLFILFSCCSFLLNGYFYYSLKKEQEKVKNAMIPSLNGDYFTERLFFVKMLKQQEERSEMEEFINSEESADTDQVLLKVKRLSQNPEYPNGCEAASATMLLNYYGINLTLKQFVEEYLPKKEVYEEKGIRYGPDPSKYYAGDPSDAKRGWGCFAPVIKDAMNKKLLKTKYEVLDFTNAKLDSLKYQLPVMIWLTTDYEEATTVYEWHNKEEQKTYTYPKNSHVVLLIGFDKEYYYVNDPLNPDQTQKVKKEQLERSYDSLGRQALSILDKTIYEDLGLEY